MNELFTWSWFISVVLVGVLINLASAYIKPPIDKIMRRYSQKWKTHSTEKQRQWDASVNLLVDNPNLVTFIGLAETRARHRLVFYSLMAMPMGFVTKDSASHGLFYAAGICVLLFIVIVWAALSELKESGRLAMLLVDVQWLETDRAVRAAVEITDAQRREREGTEPEPDKVWQAWNKNLVDK